MGLPAPLGKHTFVQDKKFDLLGLEETALNPQPLPPKEQPYYGALLVLLSNTPSLEHMQETLRTVGESLMKNY